MRTMAWVAAAVLGLSAMLEACGGPEDGAPDDAVEQAVGAEKTACGKDTWKSYAGKFFRAECAGCHGSALSTAAKVKASGAKAAISSKRMPKGKALSAAQRKRILAWFACGGP